MQIVAATEVSDDFLDSTDHIAYQFSNLIQANVLFFNVDRHSAVILNVSTNIEEWLGVSADDVLGRVLEDRLLPGISNVLKELECLVTDDVRIFQHRVRRSDGQPLVCRVVSAPARWLIELELEHYAGNVGIDTEQLEKLLLEGIQSTCREVPVQELIDGTTRKVRELLGFERGMCYRFDEDNNGEVIAESTAVPGQEKYMGLRFPARDIPRTAREMLLTCPVRTTFDQAAECSQIYPAQDPQTHQYIDLTLVRSRGAAGSCRQFYLNMNIRSSFVLPLIVENRLWGLLSFHDIQPKHVSAIFDEHLQALAKCLSIALERNLRTERERIRKKGLQVVKVLSEVDSTSSQWLRHVQSQTNDLKDLIPCSGFILRLSGEVLESGVVPTSTDRLQLIDALWELAQGKPLISNRLETLRHDLGKYTQLAAGVIAIPLSASHDDMAIWLRPEQHQTVRWAGDPLSHVEMDEKGRKRLGPRESFDLWTRVTKNTCQPWTEQDLSLATSAAMQLGVLTLSWYAAQASHAKTQFLSCMSHEIRTPMTAILGYANLLKEQQQSLGASDATSPTSDFVDIIERNGQHLLSVIDDILNLAKIEAGKLTVERIWIPIADLLTDVVALIKVQAETKRLVFNLEMATPIPKLIFSDQVRLRQILLNLLGNAFKFTEVGKVTLRVGYMPESGQMHFDVIDTGIGLTEAQVGRLFNAFTQADSSTTRRFGGSGLGLQISKNLAQLLGGDITVQSEPGVGSVFQVTIATACSADAPLISRFAEPMSGPLMQQDSSASSAIHSSLTSTSAALTLKSLRIMLLEDGEDNQRLLRHILTKAGAEVTVFANGRLGLESLTIDGHIDSPLRSPFPFDIVLTDMQMPEIDGYSTARALRAKGCQQPIIALTAFAMQGNDHECIQAGCDDYLSKPLKREALVDMCLRWSTNARTREAVHGS